MQYGTGCDNRYGANPPRDPNPSQMVTPAGMSVLLLLLLLPLLLLLLRVRLREAPATGVDHATTVTTTAATTAVMPRPPALPPTRPPAARRVDRTGVMVGAGEGG
jgi:hypothetical protein